MVEVFPLSLASLFKKRFFPHSNKRVPCFAQGGTTLGRYSAAANFNHTEKAAEHEME